MPVVVVESPAKAKTINKYLGPGYTVLASYGHVRDLPSKDGSVDPDDGFAMTWEVPADSARHIRAIAEALSDDRKLILATDPDREGEAISWHLLEALTRRRAVRPARSQSTIEAGLLIAPRYLLERPSCRGPARACERWGAGGSFISSRRRPARRRSRPARPPRRAPHRSRRRRSPRRRAAGRRR